MIFQFPQLIQQEEANLIPTLSCKGFFQGAVDAGLGRNLPKAFAGGRQTQGWKRNAPPVVPLPLSNGNFQSIVDPCRKGKGIVTAGIEGLCAKAYHCVAGASCHLEGLVGNCLNLRQMYLKVLPCLCTVRHLLHRLLQAGDNRIPNQQLFRLILLTVRIGYHMKAYQILSQLFFIRQKAPAPDKGQQQNTNVHPLEKISHEKHRPYQIILSMDGNIQNYTGSARNVWG